MECTSRVGYILIDTLPYVRLGRSCTNCTLSGFGTSTAESCHCMAARCAATIERTGLINIFIFKQSPNLMCNLSVC